jgi:Domain of unknown function (DUF4062)
MPSRKKLQVFISSTFIDLQKERQAAVEAILSANHIPAGMELFTAGDEAQMTVINRWIDESDVFMLILGGRYGSIEKKSRKSYIHLEYEHAMAQGKAHFVVDMSDRYLDQKVRDEGKDRQEQDDTKAFGKFKVLVTANRTVPPWDSIEQMKSQIKDALREFERRPNLLGWYRGQPGVNPEEQAAEIARLKTELASRLSTAPSDTVVLSQPLTYQEWLRLLRSHQLDMSTFSGQEQNYIASFQHALHEPTINLFHAFWVFSKQLSVGIEPDLSDPHSSLFEELMSLGLLVQLTTGVVRLSPSGVSFFQKALLQFDDPMLRQWILKV